MIQIIQKLNRFYLPTKSGTSQPELNVTVDLNRRAKNMIENLLRMSDYVGMRRSTEILTLQILDQILHCAFSYPNDFQRISKSRSELKSTRNWRDQNKLVIFFNLSVYLHSAVEILHNQILFFFLFFFVFTLGRKK